jgi:hypothetical protein
MDRARPVPHNGGAKTVQLHIAKMSLGDLIAGDRLAESLIRQGIELATAAIGAVAIDELSRLHGPFHRHDFLSLFFVASRKRLVLE